jgi:quinol monooxygenase YgiN
MSVKMTVQWSVPLGESYAITTALHRIMQQARQERGCLGYKVVTSAGRRAMLEYMEEWDSEERLQHELRSDRFCSLASVIESASEPPVVEFTLPDGTRGLDYIEQVRALGRR